MQKVDGNGAFLDVQMSLCVAGAGDDARGQKSAKCEGFVAISETVAGLGHLKRISADGLVQCKRHVYQRWIRLD